MSGDPKYVFRGGYIEDEAGDRWWSAELLAKVEKERDEAQAQRDILLDASKEGSWMARALDAERNWREAQERLREAEESNRMACENTPTKGCECPGCEYAREVARR